MPRPTAASPRPPVLRPTFTPEVMSFTFSIVCRTSGSVSFSSSLVVSSSSSGTKCSAKPDEQRGQGERHDQGGHPKREPHEALTAQGLNTRGAPTANTPAIVNAGSLVAGLWFGRFAAGSRHESGERLQEQREGQSRQHVGLAEANRRQPEEVPKLAQAEAEDRKNDV